MRSTCLQTRILLKYPGHKNAVTKLSDGLELYHFISQEMDEPNNSDRVYEMKMNYNVSLFIKELAPPFKGPM